LKQERKSNTSLALEEALNSMFEADPLTVGAVLRQFHQCGPQLVNSPAEVSLMTTSHGSEVHAISFMGILNGLLNAAYNCKVEVHAEQSISVASPDGILISVPNLKFKVVEGDTNVV
jgi:hypothetical protein